MALSPVVEVESNVFCAKGTSVNWVILREGSEATLIDSGYPGDAGKVEASLRAVGIRAEAVDAILLTHAHIDHMGSVNHFHARYGTPLYASRVEVPHARREYLQQATPAQVAANAWRPGVAAWALRITLAGGTRRSGAPHARPFLSEGALDLPGRPVPVPTAGHTTGHTAFLLPAVGALVTGDGLVTGHPTSRLSGPQLLPTMFNHCTTGEALTALESIAHLDAGVLIPGHGAPLHAPVREAIAVAKDNARSPRYW